MIGLGKSYWNEVISVLRSVIPVYNKVNKIISLGKDEKFRINGIKNNVFPNDLILDAGSGFGNMSLATLEILHNQVNIVMYDPIFEMLLESKRNNSKFYDKLFLSSGIFESLPFRNDCFDVVMCGYSLRDAINLEIAISEIHRVLKNGGRFIIIDLGKPNNRLIRLGVSFYLKYFLSIFAFVVAGKNGLKFKTLYGTFLKWPKNENLKNMLLKKFTKVEFITKLMGASIIVSAYK